MIQFKGPKAFIALITLLISVSFSALSFAQTPNTNYIRTRVPQIPVTDTALLDTIPAQRQSVMVEYSDALGRTSQTVQMRSSANQMDVITPYLYDNMGRMVYSYLFYPDENTNTVTAGSLRANAPNNVINFYNPSNPGAPKTPTDASPYAQAVYEASPLGRVIESGAVGSVFQPGTGHTTRLSYLSNIATDSINYYSNISGNGNVTVTAFLPGVLSKTVVTDENGNQIAVWKDLQGRVVTKTQLGTTASVAQNTDTLVFAQKCKNCYPNSYYSTDYAYNDLNQLSNIVTAFTKKQISTTGSVSVSNFIQQSYDFHYDSVGRLVERKIPGKGWIYTVYNHSDKPVLSQDSNMRAKNQWMYMKYDAEGRIVQTGIYVNTTVTSRKAIQKLCDTYTVLWETWQPGTSYTNNAFPQQSTIPASSPLSVYTIYYYDDYSFTEASSKPFQTNIYNTVKTSRTMGILTGVSIYVLGTTNQRLVTVNYYDNQNRLIQQLTDNHLGQVDEVNSQYNFIGELTGSQRITTPIAGSPLTVKDRYVYDQSGRLLDTYESFQGSSEVDISHNVYNEIGQKVSEGLHAVNFTGVAASSTTITENTTVTSSQSDIASSSVTLGPGFSFVGTVNNTYKAAIGASFAQTQEFRYNIRGLLTNINNGSLTYDNGVTESDPNALFGETISYDQPVLAGATPQYNGNISAITWRNKIEQTGLSGLTTGGQGYAFNYDNYNRLTQSTYFTQQGASFAQSNSGAFQEKISGYDEMGNIDSLQRRDKSGNLINSLAYTYPLRQNQLSGIHDSGSQNITGTFTYDGNGNMTGDSWKGITITYNYLNLIDTVKQGNSRLVFTYDATGNKLYKQLIVNGTVTSQRHYVEDAELTASSSVAYDGKVESIATIKGRILMTGSDTYQYEYYLQDHLGNNRVTFRPNADGSLTLGEVQNYYPFGGSLGDATMNYSASPLNLYQYNGKDLQPELNLNTYDFGARHYNPALGRWMGIDPMAEQYASFSTYNYVENNPMNLIDPDGMGVDPRNYQYGFPIGGGTAAAVGSAAEIISIASSLKQALGAFDMTIKPTIDLNGGLGKVQGNQVQLNTAQGAPTDPKGPGPKIPNANQGGEFAPNSAYTTRDGNVAAKSQIGQLLIEYISGTGPERSLFFGNSNIVQKYLRHSIYEATAVNAFFAGGQKPIDHMQVDFNLWEATAEYVINANEVNITSFLGSARMSVTPVGNMLRLQLDNTTDQHSLDAHLPWIQGVPRSPGQLTPQGTTYQRFIWYVEIK